DDRAVVVEALPPALVRVEVEVGRPGRLAPAAPPVLLPQLEPTALAERFAGGGHGPDLGDSRVPHLPAPGPGSSGWTAVDGLTRDHGSPPLASSVGVPDPLSQAGRRITSWPSLGGGTRYQPYRRLVVRHVPQADVFTTEPTVD